MVRPSLCCRFVWLRKERCQGISVAENDDPHFFGGSLIFSRERHFSRTIFKNCHTFRRPRVGSLEDDTRSGRDSMIVR